MFFLLIPTYVVHLATYQVFSTLVYSWAGDSAKVTFLVAVPTNQNLLESNVLSLRPEACATSLFPFSGVFCDGNTLRHMSRKPGGFESHFGFLPRR